MQAHAQAGIRYVALLLAVAGCAAPGVFYFLIVSGPTPTASVGVPYSSAVVVASPPAGTTAWGYHIDGLPPGLEYDSHTGAITGVPTATGTYYLTGSVTAVVHIADPLVVVPAHGVINATITVTSPVGIPMSSRTSAFVIFGLAGVGFLVFRQQRA